MDIFINTNLILSRIESAIKKREKEDVDEWGPPIGGDMFTRDNPEEEDVPYTHDENPYKTQWIPGESDDLREQEEEVKSTEKIEKTLPEPDPAADMAEDTGDMSGGEMGDMSGGAGGMGMPGMEEEEKDPKELGRVYELKKIYARLISVESYLSTSSDIEILSLRKYVSQAIEMFKTLAANVEAYKDRIDNIIKVFYKFLDSIYEILEKYYKKKKAENEKKE